MNPTIESAIHEWEAMRAVGTVSIQDKYMDKLKFTFEEIFEAGRLQNVTDRIKMVEKDIERIAR